MTEPKLLYQYPDPKVTVLDADITRTGDGRWVITYVAHDGVPGIKMAFSDSINSCGEYPHYFGFAESSDFKTFTNLGHFNEGVMKTTNFTSPKHAAVIQITAAEKDRLESHWAD